MVKKPINEIEVIREISTIIKDQNLSEIEIERDGEENKVIGITRAHLEEDAGKSNHDDFLSKNTVINIVMLFSPKDHFIFTQKEK